jgi:hypothetical protein
MANETENQIVVYQPNETVRLDVRLENETVWLTQSQMGELFGCTTRNVRLHLENIYACGELLPEATRKDFFLVRIEGARQVRRTVTCYNLDAIISVGYRVNSILGVKFRQWATSVLKEYLLRGYAVNSRFNQLEDKIDRRFAKYDTDIAELKDKVDFFVQTQTPPLQGVFYEGQLWDACSLVEKLIGRAKKTILLIDSWVGTGTLDMLAKKRKGVVVEVVTSPRGNKLAASDITKFNAQYGGLSVKTSMAFHDRFLIIDDKELYLIGASLKDLGKKCFGFTSLDKSNIPDILAKI